MAAKKDLGYGLLDAQGRVLLPLEYRSGHKFNDSTVVFHSPDKQKIIKIHSAESIQLVLEANFENISKSQTGNRPLFTFQEKGLWGLMDYNKRTILPAAYDKIQAVYDNQIIAEKDGKSGVVNFQGKTMHPFIYDQIGARFRNGNYPIGKAVSAGKRLWGMVDSAGHTLLQPEYEVVKQLYNCNFFLIGQLGKKGLVDATGRVQIPVQYGDIYELKHPDWVMEQQEETQARHVRREASGLYFKIRNTQNDLLGLWQIGKGEILKPEFQWIEVLQVGGPYAVQKNDKKALFNGAGQQLTGFDYTWLGFNPVRPNVVTAGLPDQKRTLLRLSDGQAIETEVYDEILPIRDTDTGYLVSKKGGYAALHAPDGRRLTPHKYKAIHSCTVPAPPSTMPAGRRIVACAVTHTTDEGFLTFVLDDAGAEYPADDR
ncbi:MAG: WG repeat-containing protein [Lewinellaceae bacterium]|nr:WG repeat-containing protein [Lewinellaceae bacterium]